MKIGFLFPGQGSQTKGMGKDIYENNKIARDIYQKVQKITGIDVANITFEAETKVLNQTNNTQICILTMSLAILGILKQKGIKAEASAGLSLGEYTALINSKALSFEDGVMLVQKRGEYMQNLVPEGKWLMAALLGVSDEEAKEICKEIKTGFAVPANFNCPGQVVISGDEEGITQVEILAKERNVKKIKILNTAGPFHTKKLGKASRALREDLEKVTIHPFETCVIKNLDGKVYTEKDNVKEILAKHIISPVKFTKVLETMLEMGIDTFVEIGPRKNLIRIYQTI